MALHKPMLFLKFASFVMCLLAYSLAEEGEADERKTLIELDPVSFSKTDNGNAWMVAFHVHWCGHCKRLIPTLEQLVKRDDMPDVRIALLNCSEYSSFCEKFNVSGYPTILYRVPEQDEGWEKYVGLRSPEGILDFLQKLYNFSKFQIPRVQGIPEASENKNEVTFIFNGVDKVALDAVRTSLSLEEVRFATFDNLGNISERYVTLINDVYDGKTLVKKHQAPWNLESVREFIVKNKTPNFSKSGPINFGRILMRPLKHLVVLVVSSETDNEQVTAIDAVRAISREYREDEEFSFTYLEGNMWSSFLELFNIHKPVYPLIVVYHPIFESYLYNQEFTENVLHPLLRENDIKGTKERLVQYLEDIRQGVEHLTPMNTSAWVSTYLRPYIGSSIDKLRFSLQSENAFLAFIVTTGTLILAAFLLTLCIVYYYLKRYLRNKKKRAIRSHTKEKKN